MAQRTFQGAGQAPGTEKWLVCAFDALKQETEQLALFDPGARRPGRGRCRCCSRLRAPAPTSCYARRLLICRGRPGRAHGSARAPARLRRCSARQLQRVLTGPGVQINLAAARRAGASYVLLHTLPRDATLAHCVFFWVGEAAPQARRLHAMRRPAARCPPTLRADQISCLAHHQPCACHAV